MKARLLILPVMLASPLSAQVVINEIRADQSSSDLDEYFELAGPAGTDLTGYWYIVLGDGATGDGTVESVTDLSGSTIPTGGFFVAAESTFTLGTADLTTTLDFENNDNVTHMLVTGFTGVSGDDLDTNDDGILDVTPWTTLEDSIAMIDDATGGDRWYGPPELGPNGAFRPDHLFRSPDGAADFYSWNIGDFTLGADDTPGAPNVAGYVDTAIGEAHEMIVRPSSTSGVDLYFVVGSFSGTSPGTPLGSVLVPLNLDAYTLFTINNANTPALTNTFNLVNSTGGILGVDQATLNVPADPSLAGLTANHAYVLINAISGGITYASGADSVTMI